MKVHVSVTSNNLASLTRREKRYVWLRLLVINGVEVNT